jgi:type I restriction enzyme M protein
MEIPIPEDIEIQKKIGKECANIDNEFHKNISLINASLIEISRIMDSISDYEKVKLRIVADYVNDRVNNPEMENYVTTDNMVQNKRGIVPYKGNKVSSAIAYKKGDILISNIRPYLKKIWLANVDGACSPDVLVFRKKDHPKIKIHNDFLYYTLWMDAFFEFMMQDVKGKKMPRGDKDKLPDYEIKVPVKFESQVEVVSKISKLVSIIDNSKKIIASSSSRKQAVMDKYLK